MNTSADRQLASKKPMYPVLKEYISPDSNFVVLFTQPWKGVVVHTFRGAKNIGHEASDWLEASFEPYAGSVTLSN